MITELNYKLSTYEIVHKDKIRDELNAIPVIDANYERNGIIDYVMTIKVNHIEPFILDDALIIGVIIGQITSS